MEVNGNYQNDGVRFNPYREHLDILTKLNENVIIPSASNSAGDIDVSALPELPPPTSSSPLSLETLLSAIGDEVRRQACRDGVDSLEHKGDELKETNQKELEEIQKRLEDMKSKKVIDGFLKAFKIIGAVIGIIASVCSIAAGAITGNPLLIAAGVVGMITAVDGIVSVASDGKYSIAAGFTELGKLMGMDDEAAQWFGFAMNMIIVLTAVVLSFGSAAATKSIDLAEMGADAVNMATKFLVTASMASNVAGGVNQVATGSTMIAGAVYDYKIGMSQAQSKEFEAIMERIRQAMKIDEELIESEMERANHLMAAVKDIIAECNATLGTITSANPSMA